MQKGTLLVEWRQSLDALNKFNSLLKSKRAKLLRLARCSLDKYTISEFTKVKSEMSIIKDLIDTTQCDITEYESIIELEILK